RPGRERQAAARDSGHEHHCTGGRRLAFCIGNPRQPRGDLTRARRLDIPAAERVRQSGAGISAALAGHRIARRAVACCHGRPGVSAAGRCRCRCDRRSPGGGRRSCANGAPGRQPAGFRGGLARRRPALVVPASASQRSTSSRIRISRVRISTARDVARHGECGCVGMRRFVCGLHSGCKGGSWICSSVRTIAQEYNLPRDLCCRRRSHTAHRIVHGEKQEDHVRGKSVFRSGVDMVPLTVTVTDSAGRYVSGLTQRDFAVFEDGVQQSLSFFASERVPVDVALVLDVSASMSTAMPLVREAADGLIRALRTGDRTAVVAVNTSVGMPQRFTADHERAVAAIDALHCTGSTAVYDGVYITLEEFARERRDRAEVRRQVLVLLSDGLDNASHMSADEMADLARRVGASIYVVALRDPILQAHGPLRELEQQRATYAIRALAQDAGGRIFLPAATTELPAVYGAIARELASQ